MKPPEALKSNLYEGFVKPLGALQSHSVLGLCQAFPVFIGKRLAPRSFVKPPLYKGLCGTPYILGLSKIPSIWGLFETCRGFTKPQI